jgi:phosphoribosyl-AMP cyclohydrolase / phosphoribosyl-ATP pyrophosphohydrolase
MNRVRNIDDLDTLDFARSGGTVTVVAQHAHTGDVLMVAHADREALARSLASGEMHYHSRTRGLWHKGATSGNRQHVVSLHADCDRDAILALVVPLGPACHDGTSSCFGDDSAARAALMSLDSVIESRSRGNDSGSYTRRLLDDPNLVHKKLGEETSELVAALATSRADKVVDEAADVLYHLMVALRSQGRSLADAITILSSRA